jgi:hypothetical protein
MTSVAFDTLKLARRLEAAGFSAKQAGDTAEALADTLLSTIATKADVEDIATKTFVASFVAAQISEAKAEIIKWMFGLIGVQTIVLLGALFALLRAGVR